MRSSRFVTFVAIVALVLAALALWRSFSIGRETTDGGKTQPNIPPDEDRVVSAEERGRMEKYVADLQSSKQVISSIAGLGGETIDCVDVNGQPALRRPDMQGHVVQFAPATLPQGRTDSLTAEDKLMLPSQVYGLTGERCPERSVPMTRLTMDTLKRFSTLDEFLRKQVGLERPAGGGSSASTHEYAHASRTVDNWGAESVLNLWSPFVERANEFSLSQIWVTRGSGANLETVEGGVQVYRDLYGDWRGHLFIYFTPDNYGSGGCYNLSCTGFVQVNNTVHIGGGFTNYSADGGTQYAIKLLWYKDGRQGPLVAALSGHLGRVLSAHTLRFQRTSERRRLRRLWRRNRQQEDRQPTYAHRHGQRQLAVSGIWLGGLSTCGALRGHIECVSTGDEAHSVRDQRQVLRPESAQLIGELGTVFLFRWLRSQQPMPVDWRGNGTDGSESFQPAHSNGEPSAGRDDDRLRRTARSGFAPR